MRAPSILIAADPAPATRTRAWRRVYAVTSATFALAVLAQVFLAGGGIFSGPSFWPPHRFFGMLLSVIPVALLALAFPARLARRDRWMTALMLALAFAQPLLPAYPGRMGVPILAALHPVNALVLFWLALWLAERAWRQAAPDHA